MINSHAIAGEVQIPDQDAGSKDSSNRSSEILMDDKPRVRELFKRLTNARRNAVNSRFLNCNGELVVEAEYEKIEQDVRKINEGLEDGFLSGETMITMPVEKSSDHEVSIEEDDAYLYPWLIRNLLYAIGMCGPELADLVTNIVDHELKRVSVVEGISTVSCRLGVRFYTCTDVDDQHDGSIIIAATMVPFVKMTGTMPFSVYCQCATVGNDESFLDERISKSLCSR